MKEAGSGEAGNGKLFSRRLALLGAGQAVLMTLLAGRMYYLQVIEAEKYKTLADENRISLRLLPPPRGRILDRFGVPVAVNQQNFRVLIISEQSGDAAVVLDRLARIISLSDNDRQYIVREMRRKRSFVPISVREGLSWEEMARIQINIPDLPGILIDEGLARHYPFSNEMVHVLGYVALVSEKDLARDNDPLLELPGFRIGKAGIERQYDKLLRGTGGSSQVEVNAVGRVIRELSRTEGQAGSDLPLTIDSRLQSFASRALGTESGTVVVMEVMTGEVLGLASQPGYDPNAFNRGMSSEEWNELVSNAKAPLLNKPISGQYAPGSTFKMVTAMAALEAGVVRSDHTVRCPGFYEFGNARFHCWKRNGHGQVDMFTAFKQSCDVFFYDIARRLDIDQLADMANRLGLGKETGIQLPEERAGLIPTRAWKELVKGEPWQKGENLVTSIGQGYVTTTPLQLAVMTARIASGGLDVAPTIIRMNAEGGGAFGQNRRKFRNLGFSPTTLDVVRQGMWGVVNDGGGTGWRLRLPSAMKVQMAGKSGTAQVRRISKAERKTGVVKNEDLPWEKRDHALFVSYAPSAAPRYVVVVVVEHGGGGSTVAGPIAREVMIETLRLDPARQHAPSEELLPARLPAAARGMSPDADLPPPGADGDEEDKGGED